MPIPAGPSVCPPVTSAASGSPDGDIFTINFTIPEYDYPWVTKRHEWWDEDEA